jgi:hypothetical protein
VDSPAGIQLIVFPVGLLKKIFSAVKPNTTLPFLKKEKTEDFLS